MPTDRLYIYANLDLPADIFDRMAEHCKSKIHQHRRVVNLERVDHLVNADRGKVIEIVAFFARRIAHDSTTIADALAMINRTDRTLEMSQLKQDVAYVTLMDCGELLSGPLSDFNLIAQYLEVFSEGLIANAEGKILAADYDIEADDLDIIVRDTREAAFVEHVIEQTKNSLASLNSGMGQGDLPYFSN